MSWCYLIGSSQLINIVYSTIPSLLINFRQILEQDFAEDKTLQGFSNFSFFLLNSYFYVYTFFLIISHQKLQTSLPLQDSHKPVSPESTNFQIIFQNAKTKRDRSLTYSPLTDYMWHICTFFTSQFKWQSSAISLLWFIPAKVWSCLASLSGNYRIFILTGKVNIHKLFKNLSWFIHFSQTFKALKMADHFSQTFKDLQRLL